MRIYEIIGSSLLDHLNIIDEEAPTPPLTPEKLRRQKDRDQKRVQKASEITRIAAVKAATVRAGIGS